MSNIHIEIGSQCKCNPKLVIENGTMIFIHNSFNNREQKERLIESICSN